MAIHVLFLDSSDAADATLSAQLVQSGFLVRAARDIDDALRQLQEDRPFFVLIRSEDGTAVHWCRSVHLLSTVPVVVVCTGQDEQTVVRYLEAGADSVLAAPLSRRELAARIGAVLGCGNGAQPVAPRAGKHRVGDLVIDSEAHTATKAGRHLPLTPTEFRLLVALARRGGQTVSYADLLGEVWAASNAEGPEILRLYIGYLRQKLGDDAEQPRILFNHRGVGYSIAAEATAAKAEGNSNGHFQPQQ